MLRTFGDLNSREVLALAINVERRNAEKYKNLANAFSAHKDVHILFNELHDEELDHMDRLLVIWEKRFGSDDPLDITDADIKEQIESLVVDSANGSLLDDLGVDRALKMANKAEASARDFYLRAAKSSSDIELGRLYSELAELETDHLRAVQTEA